jgi:transcriptional regulator with XRE-family HTH domain
MQVGTAHLDSLYNNTLCLWYLLILHATNKLPLMASTIDAVYSAIGSRIREIRQAARLTQSAVAAEAKLTRQSVANIEKGRQRFMLHTLLDISRALDVEPASLLPAASSLKVSLDVDQFGLTPKAKRFVLSVLESKGRQ